MDTFARRADGYSSLKAGPDRPGEIYTELHRVVPPRSSSLFYIKRYWKFRGIKTCQVGLLISPLLRPRQVKISFRHDFFIWAGSFMREWNGNQNHNHYELHGYFEVRGSWEKARTMWKNSPLVAPGLFSIRIPRGLGIFVWNFLDKGFWPCYFLLVFDWPPG